MKKNRKYTVAKDETLRPEYELSTLNQIGERVRHVKARREGYTTVVENADGSKTISHYQRPPGEVVLGVDVRAYFPDGKASNTALRGLMGLIPKRRSRKKRQDTPID